MKTEKPTMSVEELQSCIDKFSEDIERQKEVLKQLERSKSAAQRRLNAIRDPVAQMPLEISSEIFRQCLPPFPIRPTPRSHAVPILFLNVCNAWTDLALSTPSLWAAIHLDFPGFEILEAWLPRARNCPLSISFRRSLHSNVARLLGRYAKQLKHLEISDEDFGFHVRSFTSLGPFSVLQTLTIEGERSEDHGDLEVFSLYDTMELLRSVPNLIECTLNNVLLGGGQPEEKLVLLNLRCLKFGKSEDVRNFQSEDVILDHLSLPALETLALSFNTISSGGFSLFLKRSLPPLQKLFLGGGRTDFSFIELDEWLRLVPSLTHFELFVRDKTCTDGLFSALADSPHFLPTLRLRILKIVQDLPPPSESLYQTVFRALSTRRAQLTCVDLRALYSGPSRPSIDVGDGLRQLAADGMEIYVGIQGTNFISL
ncbi:hypothetical protein B0H13DRAFT_999254 [Mycena leptocephala]|nr:hypothetical protein B0H13DRAFT_999254 [Mycena leptocephala]